MLGHRRLPIVAELPGRLPEDVRAGTLRRRDLDAFGALLGWLGGARSVLVSGAPVERRAAALGLATAATAAGGRTILVECDLAAPALADSLGLARAPGLHEHLRGEADAGAVLRPVVLAGPGSAGAGEPLVCAAAGRSTPDGPALLSSEAFREAVERMHSAYELIVLDGGPLAEEGALVAVAERADRALAVGSRREVPRRLRAHLDGLIVPWRVTER